MKAYLNTQGLVFKLQPKTTRVGSHQDNDLCLRNAGVEESHALIEWQGAEHCYVLTDLDSSHGTYVNGCRIHNASVRLSPGNQLHFGYGGSAYELIVDSSTPLPLLGRDQSAAPPVWVWGGAPINPHPPTRSPAPRTRPASAGAKQPGQSHALTPPPHRLGQSHAQTTPSHRPGQSHGLTPPSHRPGSWPGNTGSRSSARSPVASQSLQSLQHLLQEKEERVLRLGDDVCRLSVFESECVRKDHLISSLRDEVSALTHQLTHSQAQVDVTHTLNSLQTEISLKTQQIQDLKDQLCELQLSGEQVKQVVTDRDMRISSLRAQLDRLKSDNTKNSGLVSSLQGDLLSRDRHTLKLTAEIDGLRQDIRHKDAQLQNLSNKFSRKQQTDSLAHEEDVNTLKKSVESLDASLRDTKRDLRLISSDRDSLRERLQDKTQDLSSLKVELDRQRQQLVETQNQQQNTHNQLQVFRKQILQATKTATNPSHTPSDQEVLEAVRALAGQERALQSRVQELQQQHTDREEEMEELKNSGEEERRKREEERIMREEEREEERRKREEETGELRERLEEGEREREEERETLKRSLEEEKRSREEEVERREQETEALKRKFEECQNQLQESFSMDTLQRGVCELQEVVCVCPSLSAVQTLTHTLLNTLLTPLQEAESLLKHAGIDVTNTSDGLVCAIRLLCQQKEQCHVDLDRLQLVEGQLEEEGSLKQQVEQLRAELEACKTEESVLRGKLQSLEAKLEEAERREEDWRTSAKEREQREEEWRKKAEAAEEREDELMKRMKEEEERQRRAQEERVADETKEEGEGGMNREKEEEEKQNAHAFLLLQQRLLETERERDELKERRRETERERDELKERRRETERERDELKERRRETERERDELKERLTEMQSELKDKDLPTHRSHTPSKRGSSPDSLASLRASLSRAQQEVVSRDDIIGALSRDLGVANTQMTDMTGEMSEQQKAELERHRVLVVDQRVELSALTQRLAMMSQLVEQKDRELEERKDKLRQSMEANQKREMVKELEYPSLDLSSQDPTLTQEVAVLGVASGLSEQGLKCRGHRHEEVMRLQQEALSELRSRIRALELNWPIKLLSQHQDPTQKKLLQKSQKAMGQKKMMASMCGFPLSSAVLSEASLERTARLDMTDALELSETTYLDLARALCEALELSEGQLPGCAPLRHLSPGQREQLASLRQRDLELLRSRLALASSQTQRTLLQLQDSQREIHTLRESQAEMQQLRSRLESVCVELQREREETALLREAMERTHTHLERTHTLSGRQRSTTHTSTQRKAVCVDRHERKRVPHNCGQKTEYVEKLSAGHTSLQGKLKKRDYEVETLKRQLGKREEELTSVTSQLTCMTSQQAAPPEPTPIVSMGTDN